MNSKGVFITFMVFLLAGTILFLHNEAAEVSRSQEQKLVGQAAFDAANDLFNNIFEEAVGLHKEGFAREVQQRTMPFQYTARGESIVLSQRLPLRESLVKNYVDTLNAYSVFLNNQDETAGMKVNTKTIQNQEWGGFLQFPDFNYAILPQCLLYDLNIGKGDANYLMVRELSDGEKGCTGGFDYADLNRLDINISINSEACTTGSIGGNTGLVEEAWESDNHLPYLRIVVNETGPDCPGEEAAGCPITGEESGVKVAAKHFDPESFSPATEIDSLKIYCNASDWLRVKAGRQNAGDPFPVVVYNWLPGQPADIDLNLSFDQAIRAFSFTGFEVKVSKQNFYVERST